ncbi:MAG: MFS transporter [Ruminiclostridium sp.]|nr:MFS transporter [Ruminiclostridium sp.]
MKSPYYGWVVCLVSTLLLFVTMGTVSNGFSVYLPYIMAQHGFTHAQTSSLVTLRCLVSFFAMLAIGFYYKKVSIRLGVTMAAGCAGLAFLLYSVAETYPVFCIGAAISGLSYGLGSMIPVSILMNRWFVEHRALALSICGTGSGIATILLPPVTTALIERLSMAAAFRLEAWAVFLFTLIILLFLRNDPTEKGLKPYGWEHAHPAGVREEPARSFTLTGKMWALMACASLCMGALANPGFSHLSVLFTSEGFDPMVVAAILSGAGVVITLAKLGYGGVTDAIGGCKSSLLFGGVLLVGHVLCCLAFLQSLPVTILTVLCLGIGYPIATIGPSIWANDMASADRYPTVVRRLQVIYAGGALVFASVPGLLADRFGSYISAYLLFSGAMALTLLCIAWAYGENKKRKI